MLNRVLRPLALAAAALLAFAAAPAAAQMGGSYSQPSQPSNAQGSTAAQRERAREEAQSGLSNGAARPTTAAQRTRGMAEAPAVLQASGLTCQLADAIWIGNAGQRKAYEVACTGGLGYILITAEQAGGAPTAQDCVAIDTLARRELAANPAATPNRCSLPGNADPKVGLQPLVTQAGRTCTVNNARAIGEAAGVVRYEIGCAEGPGYLLDRPTAGSTQALHTTTCLEASAANIECQYSSRDVLMAGLQRTFASQTPACAVSNFRWMGRPPGRDSEFIEVACGANAGYVAEVAANGSVTQWVTCGSADRIGGGCQLTNAAVAQTQDVALYAASARSANIDCAVDQYRRVGIDSATGREVVELTCGAGHPGVIAYFQIPGRQSQPAQGVDCLRGQARGIPCRLTPSELQYQQLGQLMSAAGSPCAVSAIRSVGRLEQEDLVEVACDAATRGFFVALPVAQTSGIGRVIRCVDARQIGGGCQLPANRAGDRPAAAAAPAAPPRR